MVKFARADGTPVWVNPNAVSLVCGCGFGSRSGGYTEIYYIGERDKGDIVADTPERVADKLSHAMKYGVV